MSDARSSLKEVRDGLEGLSLSGTKRSASEAGFDVDSTYKSGSHSDEVGSESGDEDRSDIEKKHQPPQASPTNGKNPRAIIKPHYGYRWTEDGQEWYAFCTFELALFSWDGYIMVNYLQNPTWAGLRKDVEHMRDEYDSFRRYNLTSEICGIFLEQYSKPEEMPWKSDLEKDMGPIVLLYQRR